MVMEIVFFFRSKDSFVFETEDNYGIIWAFLLQHMLENIYLVVKALDFQSRGRVFKTTGWLQGRLSLSSFQGR